VTFRSEVVESKANIMSHPELFVSPGTPIRSAAPEKKLNCDRGSTVCVLIEKLDYGS
jgi:hypothetical protein